MKTIRIGVLTAMSLLALGLASCTSLGNKPGANQQLVKVARGDLTVKVSGSGNLQAVNSRSVSFGVPGQIASVYVTEGQKVAKGDRIASLVADSLELAVSQAQLGVSQAQLGLVNADVAVKSAQQILDAALGRPTYTEVETAQSDVDEAKSYLQYVTSNMGGVPPDQQQMWAAALIYAQAKLAAAEAKLNALVGNYDTEEVALKRLQLTAATQSRDLAAQSLKFAQDSLKYAEGQLGNATIVAPFDGLVAKLSVKDGDTVSPGMAVAQIVDPSAMQLDVQVDEIDVVDVFVGQKVMVDVDALPNLTIEGVVGSIGLVPTPQSGVVVYTARITLSAPGGVGLRSGMGASADIVVDERKSVLLVPDRAIGKNAKGELTVALRIDGKNAEQVVTAGITDGVQTEIVSGLKEGDTVVVERASSASPGLF